MGIPESGETRLFRLARCKLIRAGILVFGGVLKSGAGVT